MIAKITGPAIDQIIVEMDGDISTSDHDALHPSAGGPAANSFWIGFGGAISMSIPAPSTSMSDVCARR